MNDLTQRVLLFVAERVGRSLDRVEVQVPPRLPVREILMRFCETGPNQERSVEVRGALLELIERGCLRRVGRANDTDLLGSKCEVDLSVCGLMTARQLNPTVAIDAGPTKLVVPVSGHAMKVRFETGDEDLDRKLNRSGTALGCFLILVAREFIGCKELTVGQVQADLEAVAVLGLARRSGPRADKLGSTAESVIEALELVKRVLPIALDRPGKRAGDESSKRDRKAGRGVDARRASARMKAKFPVFEIVAARRDAITDWLTFQQAALCVVTRSRSHLTLVNRVVHGDSS